MLNGNPFFLYYMANLSVTCEYIYLFFVSIDVCYESRQTPTEKEKNHLNWYAFI